MRASPSSLLAGVPRVVVRDGEPVLDVLDVLDGERITMDDVFEACRKQGIRSVRDVELGVLEVDGTFSFFVTRTRDDRDGARDDHELH